MPHGQAARALEQLNVAAQDKGYLRLSGLRAPRLAPIDRTATSAALRKSSCFQHRWSGHRGGGLWLGLRLNRLSWAIIPSAYDGFPGPEPEPLLKRRGRDCRQSPHGGA